MKVAENIIHSFSHLFFPHNCVGCGSDLVDMEQLLCLQCLDELPFIHFSLHDNNPVEKIFRGRISVEHAMSLLYFTKDAALQQVLHQFKYRGKKEIGLFFGRMMGNALGQSGYFNAIDGLVPLPLFASREKKRGYIQATVLCEGIAEITGIPVLKHAIIRTSATETQTHKNRIRRWQNMEGKFELLDIASLQNKHVLLIDDVVTTGATLESCAAELLHAPGVRVSIATLAFTLPG
jgi:ComF family protein